MFAPPNFCTQNLILTIFFINMFLHQKTLTPTLSLTPTLNQLVFLQINGFDVFFGWFCASFWLIKCKTQHAGTPPKKGTFRHLLSYNIFFFLRRQFFAPKFLIVHQQLFCRLVFTPTNSCTDKPLCGQICKPQCFCTDMLLH